MKLSDLKNALECDLTLEQSGVWITDSYGLKWKIKRLSFLRNEQYRLNIEALKDKKLSERDIAVRQKIFITAFVDACLLDWEGITDDNEEPIPFERDTAIDVLFSMPDLYDEVFAQATKSANFKKEEDLKNLSNASSGDTLKPKTISNETLKGISTNRVKEKRAKSLKAESNPS